MTESSVNLKHVVRERTKKNRCAIREFNVGRRPYWWRFAFPIASNSFGKYERTQDQYHFKSRQIRWRMIYSHNFDLRLKEHGAYVRTITKTNVGARVRFVHQKKKPKWVQIAVAVAGPPTATNESFFFLSWCQTVGSNAATSLCIVSR